MPNSLVELYRKDLASRGQIDNRPDDLITLDLGKTAEQANRTLFDAHPDFAQEYYDLREANAPSLAGEAGRALKGGAQGLVSTAYGGLGLFTGSDTLKEKAKEWEEAAGGNAPTIATLEDIQSPRDAARYGIAKVGSVAPSIAESVGSAAIGAGIGTAAAPVAGTVAGGVTGLVGKNLVKIAVRKLIARGEQATAANVAKEAARLGAYAGGMTANAANSLVLNAGDVASEGAPTDVSIGLGIISAIPDTILPAYVLNKLFGDIPKKAAVEAGKSFLARNAVKIAEAVGVPAEEFGQEYFQEFVNVVARNVKEGRDPTDMDDADWRRLREAGIAGAAGGLLAAPVVMAANRSNGETTPPAAIAARRAAAARALTPETGTPAVEAPAAAVNAPAQSLTRQVARSTDEAQKQVIFDLLAEKQASGQELSIDEGNALEFLKADGFEAAPPATPKTTSVTVTNQTTGETRTFDNTEEAIAFAQPPATQEVAPPAAVEPPVVEPAPEAEKNMPGWAREMMIQQGLDPNRPLNDVDLQNPSIRAAIEADPTLTPEQKAQLLKTGSPNAPVVEPPPADPQLLPPARESVPNETILELAGEQQAPEAPVAPTPPEEQIPLLPGESPSLPPTPLDAHNNTALLPVPEKIEIPPAEPPAEPAPGLPPAPSPEVAPPVELGSRERIMPAVFASKYEAISFAAARKLGKARIVEAAPGAFRVVFTPKGASFKLPGRADGVPDIIDAIQDVGGVPAREGRKGGEWDGHADTFTGDLQLLVRKKPTGANGMDQFLKDQLAAAYPEFEKYTTDPSAFYEAVLQAKKARERAVADVKTGTQEQRFMADAVDGSRPNPLDPKPEDLPQDEVPVGTTFTVRRQPFEVSGIKDDGTLIVKDGDRYGTQDVPPGTVLKPDKGSVVQPETSTDFAPEEPATPEDLAAKEKLSTPPPAPGQVIDEKALKDSLAQPRIVPLEFGPIDESTGVTVDLRNSPQFENLTPEQADKFPVTGAKSDKSNASQTRVAAVMQAPGGHWIVTGLTPPQELNRVGKAEKATGPALQKFGKNSKTGKTIVEGGKAPALLSDAIAAGYKLKAIIHFKADPGVIFQKFDNEAAFDAAYKATEKFTGTPNAKIAPTANPSEGVERRNIRERLAVIQSELEKFSEQLNGADPAEAAAINDEIKTLLAERDKIEANVQSENLMAAEIRFKRSADALTELARNHESFKDWYDDFRAYLETFLGSDREYAPLISELLAATSAATSVQANIPRAVNALREFLETGAFSSVKFQAHQKNLDRAVRGERLSGPKISQYSDAIFGNDDAIAVDRHIAQILFGVDAPSDRQIKAAKRRIRQIAVTLGWTPRQAQAALWAANQSLKGKVAQSYEAHLETHRSTIRRLFAADRAGESRGLEAARRIAQRIGEARRAAGTGLGADTGPSLESTEPTIGAQADRTEDFANALARFRQVGMRVDVFAQTWLRFSLAVDFENRLATMAADDPRRPTVEANLKALNSVRGVQYTPWHIAVGLDDVHSANLAGLITLIHEGSHAVLGRSPEMRAKVLRAVGQSLERLRAELATSQQQTGLRENRLDNPEELVVSHIAQKLALEGIPDSPSVARAVWQWVKDLYFRAVMGVQAAFGREPSPKIALDWFENEMRRLVGGSYDYRIGNVLFWLRPQSDGQRAIAQTLVESGAGTPANIPDFVDTTTKSLRQPITDGTSVDGLKWNLRFMTTQGPDTSGELDIPRSEAVARQNAAAINAEQDALNEMLIAVAVEGMTQEQLWTAIGKGTSPEIRLGTIAAASPGAEEAVIGGERMTEPMNKEAQVLYKQALYRLESRNVESRARITETTSKAEGKMLEQAKKVNQLETNFRNADTNETTLRDQAKEMVRQAIKDFSKRLHSAAKGAELAQAVRQAEGLTESEPLPKHYQDVFTQVVRDEVRLLDYFTEISKLDLNLADLTREEIVAAIRDGAPGVPVLERLTEEKNKPLLIALATLAKKVAPQVDLLQLARAEHAQFLSVYGDLQKIRSATTSELQAMEKKFAEEKKAATFADRIRRNMVKERAKLRRLSDTIREGEDRGDLLDKVIPIIQTKIEELETSGMPAPSEWMPANGASYMAMTKAEDGKWRARERTLRFTPEGPAVNADQLLSDLVTNQEYLEETAPGSKLYELVKRQKESIEALDVMQKYPELRRLWFEKMTAPLADLLLGGGGAGGARASQQLHRFQSITMRNYRSEIEVPALSWTRSWQLSAAEAGYADIARFWDDIVKPTIYLLETEPGLEEGPALREAVRAAKRRLTTEPTPAFDDTFKDLLRKTKSLSETMLKIAQGEGLFVEDPDLRGELRNAIPRGWITLMRSMDHAVVSTIVREMNDAGWTLEFKDADTKVRKTLPFDQGVQQKKQVVAATAFDELMPGKAENEEDAAAREEVLADPQRFSEAISPYFTGNIITRWLEPFINKPGKEVFDHNGAPVSQLDVQAAWVEAAGDVATWIDLLGQRIGLETDVELGEEMENDLGLEAEWRMSMLRQLNGLFKMESKIAADANQTQNLFDPTGRPPHLLMDARGELIENLPPEHIKYQQFDQLNSRNLLNHIAFHAAFGRNGEAMNAALAEIESNLKARKAAWDNLTASSKKERKRQAEQNGWNYKELEDAARTYRDVMNARSMMTAAFGFGNPAGVLADVRGGLALLHFTATQTTNSLKTGLLNFMQLTQHAIHRRSLGPMVWKDTARGGAETSRVILGQILETFGLHLVRAAEHGRDIASIQGQAFGNIPWSELMGLKVAPGGQDLPPAIAAVRIVEAVQARGVGFGKAREFNRGHFIPFFTNMMRGLGEAVAVGNGVAEVARVESIVKAGADYFSAHPEDAANPAFRFTAQDLGMANNAWFNDQGTFDTMQRKLVEYGVGRLETLARNANARGVRAGNVLTREQALNVAVMSNNELDLMSSINTNPAVWAANPILRFATPLLGWPIRQMTSIHNSMRTADGRGSVIAAAKTLSILAAWSLPVGLAFTLMTDWYDDKILKKKSALGSIDPVAGLPLVGPGVAFAASDLPASEQFRSMIMRLSRAGNIYGLGFDMLGSYLQGLDPTSGQRPFSMDSRILAFSQLLNFGQAMSNLINTGGAVTWANVERPLIMSMGGNGALQAIDIFNNLLDLDNAEARIVMRTNAQQWLRSAGRENGVELRRSGGASVAATPITVWVREMQLAAYANDRMGFLENYRKAVDAAREEGQPEPEKKVLESWKSRNPLDVFKNKPTDYDMTRMLGSMSDNGREAVTDALRLFREYSNLISPSVAERYVQRIQSNERGAMRRAMPDIESLRRQMAGATFMR